MRKFVLAVAMVIAAGNLYAGEFGYQIPHGWVDLLAPGADHPQMNPALMADARSGKYVVFAVDPEMVTADGFSPVSLNIIENPRPLRITPNVVRAIAAETMNGLDQYGLSPSLDGTEVLHIGSAPVGHHWYRVASGAAIFRQDQFLISGKKSHAAFTFTCPPHLHDQYEGMFLRSVMATTGASKPVSLLSRAVRFAAGGALIGLLATAVLLLTLKRSGKPAPPVAQPVSVWDCPTCKRRVPIRLEACRCGAAKPA